jgi:hypothetical protein
LGVDEFNRTVGRCGVEEERVAGKVTAVGVPHFEFVGVAFGDEELGMEHLKLHLARVEDVEAGKDASGFVFPVPDINDLPFEGIPIMFV